jgi:hypothetical protein
MEDSKMDNRLSSQPPASDKPGRPAANRRSGAPRSKGTYPEPPESLKKPTQVAGPTEARLVLAPGADADVFREAFTEVWEKIPSTDRQTLLAWWASDEFSGMRTSDNPTPPRPRPNFLLLPDGEVLSGDVEVRFMGAALAFRASLTTSNRERLRPTIAEALAKTYRFATRRHWYLVDEIKEPYEAWEAEHPDATDDERQRKWDAGTPVYFRRLGEEIDEILHRWGLGDLASANSDNT